MTNKTAKDVLKRIGKIKFCFRLFTLIVFIILMIIPYVLQFTGILLEMMVRWIFDFKYLLKSVRNGWGDYDGTNNYTIHGSSDGGESMYEIGRFFAKIYKKIGNE